MKLEVRQSQHGIPMPAYQPRDYQLEMLDASMRQNIIVSVCCLEHPARCKLTIHAYLADDHGQWEDISVCLEALGYRPGKDG